VGEDLVVTSPEPSVPDDGQHPELSVHQPSPKVCVITVACEVDMVTTPAFGQLLSQELAAGHPVLLVDLGGCEFMGSSGLAALMAARDQASQTGTQLALTGLTRTVARALAATGLEPLFVIYPGLEAALSLAAGD
jgi:anti-sigma B factor antagonist